MKFAVVFLMGLASTAAVAGDRLTDACAAIVQASGVSATDLIASEIAPLGVAVSFLNASGGAESYECWFEVGAGGPRLTEFVLDRDTGASDPDATAYANTLLAAQP